MNEEIVKQVYTILKQYISHKDMQQAPDHLVDDLQELLDELELLDWLHGLCLGVTFLKQIIRDDGHVDV